MLEAFPISSNVVLYREKHTARGELIPSRFCRDSPRIKLKTDVWKKEKNCEGHSAGMRNGRKTVSESYISSVYTSTQDFIFSPGSRKLV